MKIYRIFYFLFFISQLKSAIGQKYVNLDIKCSNNKTNSVLSIKLSSLISDTLIVTNGQNCVDCLYIDSIPGDADYAKDYKYFSDNHLAGIEHLRIPYKKLAKNESVFYKFKYSTSHELNFVIRVFNNKLKKGIKIYIVLKPNKYISYNNMTDSYYIEKIEEIVDFFE
jgi:hypothetical protein